MVSYKLTSDASKATTNIDYPKDNSQLPYDTRYLNGDSYTSSLEYMRHSQSNIRTIGMIQLYTI